MKTKTYLLLMTGLLSFSLTLTSCSTTVTPPDTQVPLGPRKLVVVNEGVFTRGNASIDVFNYSDSTYSAGVRNAIGDAANDIQFIDGKLYVILNGSSKLVSYDTSLSIVSTVQFPPGSGSNRIAQTGNGEAMVTSLYTPTIDVIDTKADTIKTHITVPGRTHGIAVLGGNAFITTDTVTNGVFVINTSTKAVSTVANISESPFDIIADSGHNAIILFGQGNYNTGAHPDIVWLDATTKTVLKKIDLGFDYYGSLFSAIKGGHDTLFVCLGDRVVTVDLASRTINNNSFIAKGYYAGIYDPKRNELILGDAKDYQNKGAVDFYDASTGAKKMSFTSGIIPGHFVIYQK